MHIQEKLPISPLPEKPLTVAGKMCNYEHQNLVQGKNVTIVILAFIPLHYYYHTYYSDTIKYNYFLPTYLPYNFGYCQSSHELHIIH
jgi:hypothetical protein